MPLLNNVQKGRSVKKRGGEKNEGAICISKKSTDLIQGAKNEGAKIKASVVFAVFSSLNWWKFVSFVNKHTKKTPSCGFRLFCMLASKMFYLVVNYIVMTALKIMAVRCQKERRLFVWLVCKAA